MGKECLIKKRELRDTITNAKPNVKGFFKEAEKMNIGEIWNIVLVY